MINSRFGKEKISVQSIGQKRFWIGIIAGIVSAISISLAFSYSREVFRLFTSISADLLILSESELQFFNFFFSTLSTVLGLSITVWIWMSNHAHKRRQDRIYKQLSRTNALLIFWVILMVIARFGSILPIILYGSHGYDNQLNLFEEYWLLFVLIPFVVFFQNWFTVRLFYRAGKWILISLVVCFFFVFSLNLTTTVDQERINSAYYQRFEKDYQYINQEISHAERKYGIDFNPETIKVLRKWHTQSSVEQVMSLKSAFSQNKPVSMDTIILQKITIKNFKQGRRQYHRRNSIENWHYALPVDIIKQINLTNSDKNKTKELFQLLQEQIDLVNTPEIAWDEYKNFTETERRRSFGAKYNIPTPLIQQLKNVKDSLKNVGKYHEYAKELPRINTHRRE
ncbi:MAG: hypothetical protein ACQETL_13375 [Bacteroidota bacterium]